MNDGIWIAWESQRRSINLSRRIGARPVLCLDEGRGWLRYPLSIAKTVAVLCRQRGRVVFVQNPSMVLAALACLLKKPFGYVLVVDRHSNFTFLSKQKADFKRRASDVLSGYTLRNADVTIVTNPELCAHVESQGGKGFVLPDPFPDLEGMMDAAKRNAGENSPATAKPAGAPAEILFVSSWAFDEPIAATIEACRRLVGKAVVRITGRIKPGFAPLVASAPANFIPTGFLSDREYFALMERSDAVMAVTDRDATLVCGGYEAAEMGKPLILGDTPTLRWYFSSGAVYTGSSPSDLEAKLRLLIDELPRFRKEIMEWREWRESEWRMRLAELKNLITGLSPASRSAFNPLGQTEAVLR